MKSLRPRPTLCSPCCSQAHAAWSNSRTGARAGGWTGTVGEQYFGADVHGQTLGIVGLGRIGAALARRAAHGFNMRVLCTNRQPNPHAESLYGAQRRTLD